MLESPLKERCTQMGAQFTEFGGWSMPLRYTGDIKEHNAVRSAVGMFDLSHMAQIEVEGPIAGDALDAALVTMPSAMPIGRARYSLILDSTGGILDDLIVYRLAENSYLVVANAANRQIVVDELTKRSRAWCAAHGVPEQVSVTDTTIHRTMIAVQGPESRGVMTRLLNDETAATVEKLGYYRICEGTLLGLPVRIARTGYTGELGYEIMAPAHGAVPIWDAVVCAGEQYGLIPCGLAARDTLRLEAGMALYGHELTRDLTPRDVGLEKLIAPHTFVGKGAVESRPQRFSLYGVVGSGRRAARAGSAVYQGASRIGVITSGALSPTLGYPVALARLIPGVAVGAEVDADVRGKRLAMKVVELPFYSRTRPKNS